MKLLKVYVAENGSVYYPGEYKSGHLPLSIVTNPKYVEQSKQEKETAKAELEQKEPTPKATSHKKESVTESK